jgi:Cu-processing system ATP-binding protein
VTATVALQDVEKRYGAIRAVHGVSFEMFAGETVALVGHNGAGKTTLMKLMLGLVRASAGTVRVLGDDPAAGDFEVRRRIGYLPENVSFNTALTARETLSFYARLKHQPMGSALPLLDRVGIAEAASRRIGTYSKGMRQRLGLAQALVGEPEILLLDEPTTGLDPLLRRSFYEIVGEMRSRGATILLSTHALSELDGRADRVLIMDRGVLIANGSVEALRQAARLPIRIRLKMANGAGGSLSWLGPVAGWQQVDGRTIEIKALPDSKLDVLRCATGDDAPPIEDIDVLAPTLDDLYAHFIHAREGAS